MSCFDSLWGLLPSSMMDWPGKVSAVLFLGGCNFRCPYCHNPELVRADGSLAAGEGMRWEDVAAFLRSRVGWIDGLSVTGGEPTIHDDLPRLCSLAQEAGFPVKLDTNGTRPRMLRRLIEEGLLDFLAMDIKTSLEKYPMVARRPVDVATILESIDIVLESGIEHEFRCTVVPGLVDLSDLLSLARLIAGADRLVLQQFRPEHTLDASYREVRPYPEDLLLRWAEELAALVPTRVRGVLSMQLQH
ncbi:MAG: anaerobic ribonucleoside-triphosphate reductase activating protein [Actinobacteria bacterium]|nr:anaerobic ribonucleoside-triphosphate reductase activating protein [Actinomycetota bacterium]